MRCPGCDHDTMGLEDENDKLSGYTCSNCGIFGFWSHYSFYLLGDRIGESISPWGQGEKQRRLMNDERFAKTEMAKYEAGAIR